MSQEVGRSERRAVVCQEEGRGERWCARGREEVRSGVPEGGKR